MTDPECHRPGCTAPNHCTHHERAVHHAVDSMARHCAKKAQARVNAA